MMVWRCLKFQGTTLPWLWATQRAPFFRKNVSLALKLSFPITATPRYQLHSKGRNPTSAIVPINPYGCQRKGEEQLSNLGSSLPMPWRSRLKALPGFVSGMVQFKLKLCKPNTTRSLMIMVIHCACKKFLCHFQWTYRIHTWKRTKNTFELVYWSAALPILQLKWVQTCGRISRLWIHAAERKTDN